MSLAYKSRYSGQIDNVRPNYFHGSNSASLPGILDKNNPGIRPTGMLLEEERVPFSGELVNGAFNKRGANRCLTSVVSADFLFEAIKYSLTINNNNQKLGWDPITGYEEIELLEKMLDGLDKNDKLGYTAALKKIIEGNIDVNMRRIEKWDELSEEDKSLIETSYPVIYGINHGGEVEYIRGCNGERGIRGLIGLDKLRIYVPNKEKEEVLDYAKRQGHRIRLGNFDELEKIAKDTLSSSKDYERERHIKLLNRLLEYN